MEILKKYIFSIIIMSFMIAQNKVPMSIVDLINDQVLVHHVYLLMATLYSILYLKLIGMKINVSLIFGV